MPFRAVKPRDDRKSILRQSSFIAGTKTKKQVFRAAFDTSEHDFGQIIVQVRDVP